MKQSIYKAHAVPAALLFSFDVPSISRDYDTGLNENKTVCELMGRKAAYNRKNCGYIASEMLFYCKIGKITIITYKTNWNKGIMTKYATKL